MRQFLFFVLFFPCLAVAAETLVVRDAWMRALAPGQPTGAAYMVLQNQGQQALTVVAVSADVAARVEVHVSSQQDGVWRMRQLETLSLSAGESMALEPGGRHLMLFQLQRSPREGERVDFLFTLSDGQQVTGTAEVRGIAGGDGHEHKHH
jgi:copper(I)-binding protein